MLSMARLRLAVLFLVACHHAETPAAPREQCPGPYAIERGTCEHLPATECKGICGYVVRRSSCAPVKDAVVMPDPVKDAVGVPKIMNGTVPHATTDVSGRFDLAGLPPGHHVLRIMAEQDVGHLELDVVEGAQPLAAPIELTLFDRSCACGGACPI